MTERRLQRLPEVLFEIGKAIGSEGDLPHLLSHISGLVCELIGADTCAIALLDNDRQRLLTKAAHGLTGGPIERISFAVGEGVAGWVVANNQPALIPDVTADPRFIVLPDSSTPIRSMACVPLVASSEPVGTLSATAPAPDVFTAADVDLLGFVARTIALDIENVRLRRVSVTDPLTGAFNREYLQQRLPAEVQAAMRRGSPLSIAMIDVDHFKAVNDHHGHEVGDRVLTVVAQRLRQSIRKDDILVRYGGEEFLAVLPDADLARAREIGERMRLTMQSAAVVIGEGLSIEVRVSVGVAEHDEFTDVATLVRRADTALYTAKGHGRNRVEVAR
jgi:diguanylate cyclase (GGDEF)-like protein